MYDLNPRLLGQGRDKAVVESLAHWVADEYLDKRKETVDTSTWRRRYLTVRLSNDPRPLSIRCTWTRTAVKPVYVSEDRRRRARRSTGGSPSMVYDWVWVRVGGRIERRVRVG